MKKKSLITTLFCMLSFFAAQSQDWMESLDVAKRLARTQDKLIVMVWEEATYNPLPVIVKDENGENIFIRDLYTNETLMELFWDYFIPIIVNEVFYEDMNNAMKGKRSFNYINNFNDDSIKVLDANGNMLSSTRTAATEVFNFSTFLSSYAINTSFVSAELNNYSKSQDFYSAFYLASRYIDNSFRFPKKVRNEFLMLSNIYLNESEDFLQKDSQLTNKDKLKQLIDLTYLKQDVIRGKARRVLKKLKKLDVSNLEGANRRLHVFLEYTANRLLNKKDEFSKFESEISLVNLKLAQAIVNINK